MLEVYEIRSPVQAKVLSHKLRLQIFTLFKDLVPRTAKQVADYFELPASKVHYHVRELERAGLIEIVETREKGGVLEKYYLPIAKEFRIHLSESEEVKEGEESPNYKLTKVLIHDFRESFLRAIAETESTDDRSKRELKPSLIISNLNLTIEEIEELNSELKAVMDRWKKKSTQEIQKDKNSYKVFLSLYPVDKKSINGNAEIT